MRGNLVRTVWFLLTALSIGFFVGILFSGCAASPRFRAGPLVRLPRPCAATLPTEVKLKAIADPESAAYLDAEGVPHKAIALTFDVDKLSAFFGYVGALEEVAQKALGCVERATDGR